MAFAKIDERNPLAELKTSSSSLEELEGKVQEARKSLLNALNEVVRENGGLKINPVEIRGAKIDRIVSVQEGRYVNVYLLPIEDEEGDERTFPLYKSGNYDLIKLCKEILA